MSAYSNVQIKQAIEQGGVICHPFRTEHLNRTSLDVTLGYYFYRVHDQNQKSLFALSSQKDAARRLVGPYRAIAHNEWCVRNGVTPAHSMPVDHPVIAIGPKERILIHTHEFIGILSPGAAEIWPRTLWNQIGIISLTSSWVGSGSVERFVFELYNTHEQDTILLPVGERIAQVVFWHVASDKTYESHSTEKWCIDLATAMRGWKPDQMLLAEYQHDRITPTSIDGIV